VTIDLCKYFAKKKKSIREHTDDLLMNASILNAYGYINQREYELLIFACEYHDYGKVNPIFQRRIVGNSKFNKENEVVHNVLSLYFIDEKKIGNKEDYIKIAHAVLNHHDYGNVFEIIDERRELIEKLLSGFATYTLKSRTIKKIGKIVNDKEAIIVKGLLHKCDYSASAEIPIEFKNDFLNEGLRQLLNKWKKYDTSVEWNDLQKFCIANSENNIVAVAQTGLGKTEAGFHWIGNNKGFFILPIKTAINAIYKRVKEEILAEDSVNEKLALLHSDMLTYYNNTYTDNEFDVFEYYQKSKQLSIPINIATLDQLFNFVFKYKGYELKLATLSYSKVVIDEIQMYSSDLLAYLIYGIHKISEFGGKFAILTATLPPFILDLLRKNNVSNEELSFEQGTFTTNIRRHNIKVYESELEVESIYKHYINNEKRQVSNKILVVCNTVKKAQSLFLQLREKEVGNLNILHSKFIKKERSVKEDDVIEFGKTYKKSLDGSYSLDSDGRKLLNNDSGIWIATQIVETSLDIDFDYLFTELSDLNSLLQRLGRCNRKGVKSIKEPNCFVFTEIEKRHLKVGDRGFIDKKIYEISKEGILDIDGVISEQEKTEMINKYFTTENLRDSDYLKDYRGHYDYIQGLYSYEVSKTETLKRFRNIISYSVIPKCIYESAKNEIDEHVNRLVRSWSEMSIAERNKSKEVIMSYTVPVGRYDIYFKIGNAISKKIKLSNYEEIFVVDCEYSETGFKRLTSDKAKKLILEDSFDNFI